MTRAIATAFVLVAALFACEEHGSRGPDGPPVPDAAPSQCLPTGGCADGPLCNGLCCGPGERCEGSVCRCGANPGCTGGDQCIIGGPAIPTTCGNVCCGGPTPCPI